ncbi:MAG: hypothetical protein HOP16_01960 [Acidobacteria bacterium]|nr:hypothetical protein [Acidobacteriota bacterium]
MNHVLIVSLSRSGGKLMRMLLDGHPAFNAFPIEHWNRTSKNAIPVKRIAKFDSLSVDEKLETAGGDHVERKISRLHPAEVVARVLQDWRNGAVDAHTLPAMYEGLSRAYFGALGRPLDAVVVNHCGSVSRFRREELDAVYGPGRHLLTIRDPRAVFISMQGLVLRKFTANRALKGKIPHQLFERHTQKLELVKGTSGYLQEFCDVYRAMVAHYASGSDVIRLRFEDLVRTPETVMRKVAGELGVEWRDTLLEPTQLGDSHSPNSSFARTGGSIHAQAADDWTGRIDPAIRRSIEDLLADEMAALGYLRFKEGTSPLLDPSPLLS